MKILEGYTILNPKTPLFRYQRRGRESAPSLFRQSSQDIEIFRSLLFHLPALEACEAFLFSLAE